MGLNTMMRTAALTGLAAVTAACAPIVMRSAEPTCDPYTFAERGASYVHAGDEVRGEVDGRSFGYTAEEHRDGIRVDFEYDGRRATAVFPSNVALIAEFGEMRPNVSPDWRNVDRLSLPVVGCGYVDGVRPDGDREGIGSGDRLEPVATRDGAVLGYLTMPFGPGTSRFSGGR